MFDIDKIRCAPAQDYDNITLQAPVHLLAIAMSMVPLGYGYLGVISLSKSLRLLTFTRTTQGICCHRVEGASSRDVFQSCIALSSV